MPHVAISALFGGPWKIFHRQTVQNPQSSQFINRNFRPDGTVKSVYEIGKGIFRSQIRHCLWHWPSSQVTLPYGVETILKFRQVEKNYIIENERRSWWRKNMKWQRDIWQLHPTWQLNWLKVKPYGRDNLMTTMYDSLTAFQVKVKTLRNKQYKKI